MVSKLLIGTTCGVGALAQTLFLAKQPEVGASEVNGVYMNLLPLETGAAALDGSPYGFYFVPSTSGSTQWTIHFQGGGWCNNEEECAERAHSDLGSSKNWTQRLGSCTCQNGKPDGTLDDCNCIHMIYMDGASFSGYREETAVVEHLGRKTELHFRGLRNLDATLDFAFENLFLSDATEMIVSGDSAGGLATILHADRIAKRMREQAPNIRRTLAIPNVGFFLDHRTYNDEAHGYTENMKYIMSMQNVTGAGGGFNQACLDNYPDAPHFCFLAPYAAPFVQTPMFIMNSRFDAWQLSNDLRLPCYAGYSDFPWDRPKVCDDAEQSAAQEYGTAFLRQLAPILVKPENGAFITTCVCHDCDWLTITIKNTSLFDHARAWYEGKVTGASAILIDGDGPNKNGKPENKHCSSFP